MKNQNKTLTIVSVTGSQTYAEGSMYAIMRSYRELQKKLPQENLKCLLVCPERPANCPDDILHAQCKPFGYLEYNYFILYGLGQLIDTDFALIVQNDGFVVNGNNWRNEFFDYDYIGAPIPCYYTISEDGFIWQSGVDGWVEQFGNYPAGAMTPQNGGFSLRSKRLLDLPMLNGYPWNILPPAPFQSFPLELKQNILLHNEDLYLCVALRSLLENKGIKFAPTELASLFSIESNVIVQMYQTDLNQVFGVHTMGEYVLTGIDNAAMCKPLPYKLNNQNYLDHLFIQLLAGNYIQIYVPKEFVEENGFNRE